MENKVNNAMTARELMSSTVESQFNSMLLEIFYQLGELNFSAGWNETTSQKILTKLCQIYPIEHAILATENAGTLTITNTVGHTLPVGSRIPMVGTMASMLKAPVSFKAYISKDLRWCTAQNMVDSNAWLLPLAYSSQSYGLLALVGKTLDLTKMNLNALHALCGLWGKAYHQSVRLSDVEINHGILNLLTPREREVFALLPSGASNIALSEKLNIAPGTVKIHVERIIAKLHVNDRTQAAVKASQLGFRSDW
jgi:DNA-binding CsgD family transcriptional regulator